MPDLTPFLTLSRYALVAYATTATVLTTACIALQAITVFDRRAYRGRAETVLEPRSLFIPLETEPPPTAAA